MKVLAAAQDTGDANALVPVVAELRRRDDARVHVLACGKAVGIFASAELDHQTLDTGAGFGPDLCEVVEQRLSQIDPDVLLLGTAWGPSLDKVLLRAVRSCEIPSLTVLDMWSNYRERFVDPASPGMSLPTKVAVMDRLALDEAVAAGLPERSLVITGQPHLEALMETLAGGEATAQAAALRDRWLDEPGRRRGGRLVMFASEQRGPERDQARSRNASYPAADALEGVAEAVGEIESSAGQQIKLVVRLHPEESGRYFPMGPIAASRGVMLVSDEPAWPCMLAADVVVGMTSMFLLESAIAGTPAVSFQPGARQADSFVGTRAGTVPTVTSVPELASLLKELLDEPDPKKNSADGGSQALAHRGATRRVVDLLLQLARHGGDRAGESQW